MLNKWYRRLRYLDEIMVVEERGRFRILMRKEKINKIKFRGNGWEVVLNLGNKNKYRNYLRNI